MKNQALKVRRPHEIRPTGVISSGPNRRPHEMSSPVKDGAQNPLDASATQLGQKTISSGPFSYVYVLLSQKTNQLYIGSTKNLRRRLKEHTQGKSRSTKNLRPLTLVYYEACLNKKNTRKREMYLKTSWGKRYLNNRVSQIRRPHEMSNSCETISSGKNHKTPPKRDSGRIIYRHHNKNINKSQENN